MPHAECLLRPLGGVGARRMFDGHGIFKGGMMFAPIAASERFGGGRPIAP